MRGETHFSVPTWGAYRCSPIHQKGMLICSGSPRSTAPVFVGAQTTGQPWQQPSRGYNIGRWEVKGGIICMWCVVERREPYARSVSVMSFCQQGLNSIHTDSPLWQRLPSRLHFICTLNAFSFIYSFISTWPSAVTLMNGSWNWPIVFTRRDKSHTLWT